jgi:DNA-binding IclR family transcriptional regulator
MDTNNHVGPPSGDAAEALAGGGVDAVDRALTIMQAFDVSNGRLSLAALAKHTGFYKSTILRLTRSLERGGYLYRESDGDFVVGPEPVRLAAIYKRYSQLEPKVRPVLRSLRDNTGESASFFQRVGTRRQCLYREESQRTIRDHVMEGDLLPLDVGAAGHVLKAFGSGGRTRAGTGRPATLPMTSFGERDPEAAALAAPVFGPDGLLGALTISGPRSRLTRQRVAEIGPTLLTEARNLSRILGGGTS